VPDRTDASIENTTVFQFILWHGSELFIFVPSTTKYLVDVAVDDAAVSATATEATEVMKRTLNCMLVQSCGS